jgi:hypothetical protein
VKEIPVRGLSGLRKLGLIVNPITEMNERQVAGSLLLVAGSMLAVVFSVTGNAFLSSLVTRHL